MIATYFNALTIVIGSLIGLLVKSRLKPSFEEIIFTSSGLITLILGFSMAVATSSYLLMLLALALGGALGYWLKIEDRILALGTWMEKVTSRGEADSERAKNFALGFLNASLLFCSGAMTVLGLIMIKSIMDGCMAVIFASVYGPGVIASALFVLVYQGFFTLAGGWIEPILGEDGIGELGAVGGVLLLMIGFNLLDIRKTKTGNFLPAMILAPIFAILTPPVVALVSRFGF
jgi:uncharacterized membrane protein YqgA involved in biofilm formation